METPTWLDKANIKLTLDARPLLATGQHPLERVISEATSLKSRDIFEILTPFPPVPMIEKLNGMGFESFSYQDEAGLYHTFFLKQ